MSGNRDGEWGDSGWEVDPATRFPRVALSLGWKGSKQMRHLSAPSLHFPATSTGKEAPETEGKRDEEAVTIGDSETQAAI